MLYAVCCMFILHACMRMSLLACSRVGNGFHLFPLIPPAIFDCLFNAVAHERLLQRNVAASKRPASVLSRKSAFKGRDLAERQRSAVPEGENISDITRDPGDRRRFDAVWCSLVWPSA
jgi:hypothetical protein